MPKTEFNAYFDNDIAGKKKNSATKTGLLERPFKK